MNIFEVKKISYHPPNKGYCVMLSHVEGSKEVPIIIGSNEAQSIALAVESVSMPRPMTHDIIVDIIDSMDISISRVEICDFRKGTFYSKIYLQGTYSDEKYIDCRPSDAIAIALRCSCPISVSDKVLKMSNLDAIQNIIIEKVEKNSSKDNEIISKDVHSRLSNALRSAVKNENYELAARIRDKIISIDQKL